MNTSRKTTILVEGAMLIALATALSYVKLFNLPQGGSVTMEMIPIIIMGLRHGTKWGCFTGFVHGLIQMIIGFSNVLYCATIIAMIGCMLLDYLLSYTVLGLAPVFAKTFKSRTGGAVFGTLICGVLRFLCNFLSGWLLWGSYAPEGMAAPIYSLVYNGSFMLPNIILAVVIIGLLCKVAPGIMRAEPKMR
ncbi:MAG: energy-coupled thiamine transporter ThiT [Lachnospiraceae bacterium]|nr:energy-coupled thiamine transporter ThiT [Lachnospiraceae bacterium]